jgi:hypothetical protein
MVTIWSHVAHVANGQRREQPVQRRQHNLVEGRRRALEVDLRAIQTKVTARQAEGVSA